MRSFKPWCLLALLTFAALTGSAALAQRIVVGAKNFTEQRLMAELTRQLLRVKGFDAISRVDFSTTGIRAEQELGLVDVYWEYTGTSLTTFNRITERLGPEEAYARVKELDARKGLVWLAPSRVNNTYALAMRIADAEVKGIGSISDLAARMRSGERIRFASNLEFFLRADGLMPLQRAYRFEFGDENVVRMETDQIYDALRGSTEVDVGIVFATDGRIAEFGLVTLRDDRGFFPSYILAPVVRTTTLNRHPALAAHLDALSAKLDTQTIAGLNAMIDLQGKPVEAVVSAFLAESGLI